MNKKKIIEILKKDKKIEIKTMFILGGKNASRFYVSVTAYQVRIYRMLEEILMKAEFQGRRVSKGNHQNYFAYHLA